MTASAAQGPKVLVVGTSNIDLSLHVDHLPESGETVMGDLSSGCGGKAANQAVAAARLGAEVSFVTRIGDDDHGQAILRGLLQEGVRTEGVAHISGGASGVALIMVDRAGNTIIGVAEGVNRFMEVADLEAAPELKSPRTTVLSELGIPFEVVTRLCELRSQVGFTFILNPAPAIAPLPLNLWGCIDVVTPNATEAEVLTGLSVIDDESALHAADRLRELGAGLAIVTLGELGVAYSSDEGRDLLPAFKVAAIDTTAASDAFSGGLAVALGSGRRHAEAIRYGEAAAALSVTRMGAQPSLPTDREVAEFLARYPSAETSS